ncbi:hypothetical protein Vadar_029862 [Vaccinium darrowii]|uniref:Uncharacterized protein n=1 Tax=Vaccinium darrowii TaxID=229202 RepID=A0ACB7ZF35_9ERIC|nr:hypothetical protein Vadar_029862 [Vaccinium darrowii]
MLDFSDSERAGSDSSGSALGSEFAEERLDVTPPNALPEYQSIRDRGGPILRLPNQVWMVGERRTDRIFYSEADLEHAISRGPWLIRGGLMVLDYWHFYDALSQIRVRRFYLRVQLHNLPFEAFSREEGEILGQALGEDVTVNIDDVFPRHFRYLSINIAVTPDSTLVPGFYLDIPGGQPRWIECRYERVYKFCRLCERIGHTYPQCDLSREEARARVDEMLDNLCTRFGSVLHTEVNVSLYTNCIRAFARSNVKRNTHMWAVRGQELAMPESSYQTGEAGDNRNVVRFGLGTFAQVKEATQTDIVTEQVDEQPPDVDFD